MPIKRVQFPDGSIKRIQVPEGATDEQVLAFAQSQHPATSEYVVTGPDGQEYEVTAPASATQDEVLRYAQRNHRGAAPQEVELPDGTVVEFPSGMKRGAMERALRAHQGNPWDGDETVPPLPQGFELDEPINPAQVKWDDEGPWTEYQNDPRVGPWTEYQNAGAGAPARGEFDDLIPKRGEFDHLIPAKRSKFGGVPVGDFDDLPNAPRKRGSNPADFRNATLEVATPFGQLDTRVPLPRSVARPLAGAGEAFATAIPGLKQAAAESANTHLAYMDKGLRSLGADGAADWLNQNVGRHVYGDVMQRRQAEQARREQDAALNETWGGRIGLAAGTAVEMIGPGGIAKLGTRVPQLARYAPALQSTAAMLMPKSVRGNAALGAMAGYLQPSTGEGDRMANAAWGAGGGAVGAGLPRFIGASTRGAGNILNYLGASGPQRQAVRMIQSEASNPQSLLVSNPSAVPGVTRSLFEESLDPGVARLETYARGAKGAGWIERDSANNAARAQAMQRFAGDEATLEQAVQARTAATQPLYAAARRGGPVDTSRLVTQVDRLIQMESGRPAVQAGLQAVRKLLDNPEGVPASVLANVRLTIGDMLDGRYGGGNGAAMQGSRALIAVRDQLDRVMGKAVPAYREANATYRAMSAPVNRMQAGQLMMLRSTGSIEDSTTGLPLFSASKLGQQLRTLDTTTRTATGSRRAKAADVFRPEDIGVMRAINDDLSRSAQRLRYGSGGGSNTQPQSALARRVAVQGVGRFVPGASVAMEFLEAAGASRLQGALNDVLQNPAQYRAVAAKLTKRDQGLLEQALIRAGGAAGRTAGVAAPRAAH